MPLQLEAKKSAKRFADKKRYRQIRDSETTEQRDEQNDKRRKKYMARKAGSTETKLDGNLLDRSPAMPLQLEAKKSADKNRYRQIRDSETTEQRDERNDKRRKKYMAQKGGNTKTKLDGNLLDLDPATPSKLEVKRSAERKRYRQRRDSETNEQRNERNEKRRKKYMAQKVGGIKEIQLDANHLDLSTEKQMNIAPLLIVSDCDARKETTSMNIPCEEAIIAVRRCKKSDKQKDRRDKRNKQRREKHKEQLSQTVNKHLKSSVVDPRFGVGNSVASTDGKYISKRMRNKINGKKRKFAMNETILDIGRADQICYYCKANMWKFEQSEARKKKKNQGFSLCCGQGKVVLPKLKETPPELTLLFDCDDDLFIKNIRIYNNAFAFTSMGGKFDKTYNDGRGPFILHLHGLTYHQIGSLMPEDGKKPVFSQLYMFDNERELEERVNFPTNGDKLDKKITTELSTMLNRDNELAKAFHHVRDRFKDVDSISAKLRLVANRHTDGRNSNNPPNTHEFAALIVDDNLSDPRDIVVQYKGGGLKRISVLNPSFMALQYPLIFPYGEDGYRTGILHRGVSTASEDKRDVVSMRQFYSFRLQHRDDEGHTLIRSGRLFLQFVVDAWACIEHARLMWVLKNQSILRSDVYHNIVDSVNRGDVDASAIGKRVILPSSFTGSPRYMQQNFQDCMAVCRKFGSPDLFITFTCNPKWPEIKEYCDKIKNVTPADRPDIMARVFKIKLDILIEDLCHNHVLGKVIGVAYTIEFQKRGLPHAHIVIWLDESDKCKNTDDIDFLISAEIPDKNVDPIGYECVSKFMVHGPCGELNPKCACMKDHKCTKFFPKDYSNETVIDSKGYAIYKRRNDGRTIMCKDVAVDNRFIVPYNRGLIVKYQAHINVEWCNQGHMIKYMFKYVTKGPDRATMAIEKSENNGVDDNNKDDEKGNKSEVDDYIACRYVSSIEACWRIFEFPIHYRKPVVVKLTFHLENQQQVCFKENETLPTILGRLHPDATMFIQWFETNKRYSSGRTLPYIQFPEKFKWDNKGKLWVQRKNKIRVIGRLIYIHPIAGELFYLRMLLNVVRGATSFEDIRTVNGVTYDTYKEACLKYGLLESDDDWQLAITDASLHQTGSQLRQLFVTLLLFSDISDVRTLWDNNWKLMSDDIEYKERKNSGLRNFTISDQRLQSLALFDVDSQLRKRGKSLLDFPSLPPLDSDLVRQSQNTLLYEEQMYDRHALADEGKKCLSMLNEKQLNVYKVVTTNVQNKTGGLFFVYGHGGTGKTFVWKTIISFLRSEGKVVLVVASSGIASLLIEGGRTAHSRFKVPIKIDENSTCNIKQKSFLAELIVQADLLIWDEAPLNHKHVFEAVDRSFRDIMRHEDKNNLNKPFGGKTVLLGGDFRQILPVLPGKGRADIVMASINNSYLWDDCVVFKLDQNMRIEAGAPPVTISGQTTSYADWVINVGDGKVETISVDDGESCWIQIPSEIFLDPKDDGKRVVIDTIYSDLCEKGKEPSYFKDRAILTPLNEDVDAINKDVLDRWPGESKVYFSSDSICKGSVNYESQESMYPMEILNSMKFAGIPNHELELKVGAPIVLLRNIAPNKGLCNGTRLIITQLCSRVIEGMIISGNHIGEKAFIPRICMRPTDSTLPFMFKRVQFPIALCYAMTVNKSQGQTVKSVGLYLPRPVFSHGQLYVAISRVTSPSGLHIVCENNSHPIYGMTKNVVYHEIFNSL